MQKYLLFLTCLILFSCTENQSSDNTQNKGDLVEELLSKMTLEEKIGQLNQLNGFHDFTGPAPEDQDVLEKIEDIKNGKVGSMLNVLGVDNVMEAQKLAVENTRLGIPMVFAHDVIHGYKTTFPIPLAESSSWDLESIELSSRIAATEASAAGLNWTFAPMVDISRDPRWGRVMEGAGEDTYLGTKIAMARVKGFQGDNMEATNTILACAKHYAGYGAALAGRDYNSVDMSVRKLRQVYLPPFKGCVDAGASTFMNAFNDINGIPSTSNEYILRDILKGEWGFEGFVVSDWGSIGELVHHQVAATKKEAAELAIKAGSDMDMMSFSYISHLKELVEEGKVNEVLIDDAVRRILKQKEALGLFEDPYRYCDKNREDSALFHPEHVKIARDVARKSIVLLKNQNGVLPLKKDISTIAVIGSIADDQNTPIGNWRSQAVDDSTVTLLAGIQAKLPANTRVLYNKGVIVSEGDNTFMGKINVNQTDFSGIEEAVATAKRADVVVVAVGETAYMSGEARSMGSIELTKPQQKMLEELNKTGKKIIVVLMNGRPLAIPEVEKNFPAIVEAWHLGTQAGNAIADVLFGDYNPSGKLPMTFPYATGQIPVFYNALNTGRPFVGDGNIYTTQYIDIPNEPVYYFGHGLSYTTFEYGQISHQEKISVSDTLRIRLEIKNTGSRSGEEVVQLYLKDQVSSISRPVKELKGFKKISLEPGEMKEVLFEITSSDLAFWNEKMEFEAEPGVFEIMVGSSSNEIRQEGEFFLE